MSHLGIIVVDHGSRLADSNRLVEQVASAFAQRSDMARALIEPAHMELAEPSIATAFARCVSRGAEQIVVLPYFLGPGKHWTTDIPQLTAAAAQSYPDIPFIVAAPLGLDPLILDLLAVRLLAAVPQLSAHL